MSDQSWFLEQIKEGVKEIAEDVRDIRDRVIRVEESTKPIASDVSSLKVKVSELEKREAKNEGQQVPIGWIVKLVIGALVTGGIGACIALVAR